MIKEHCISENRMMYQRVGVGGQQNGWAGLRYKFPVIIIHGVNTIVTRIFKSC